MLKFLIFLSLLAISFQCFGEESNTSSRYELGLCVADYRDGYYSEAIQCFEDALTDLATQHDSIEAYKMLALSYGMINQIEKSKQYFRAIIDKDSVEEIDTLELPPNIALIYNQVKLEKKVTQLEKVPAIEQKTIHPRKRNAGIPLLLSTVVLSTGGAVYLYYNGYLSHNEYSKLGNNQVMLDKKWKEFTYYIAGGVGCSVISGVATIALFKVLNKSTKVSIAADGNKLVFGYDF